MPPVPGNCCSLSHWWGLVLCASSSLLLWKVTASHFQVNQVDLCICSSYSSFCLHEAEPEDLYSHSVSLLMLWLLSMWERNSSEKLLQSKARCDPEERCSSHIFLWWYAPALSFYRHVRLLCNGQIWFYIQNYFRCWGWFLSNVSVLTPAKCAGCGAS